MMRELEAERGAGRVDCASWHRRALRLVEPGGRCNGRKERGRWVNHINRRPAGRVLSIGERVVAVENCFCLIE